MAALSFVDLVVGAILALAMFRGIWLGLIREAFSIGAIGGSVLSVRMFGSSLAGVIGERTDLDAMLAPWVAGALIAIMTIAAVALLGRAIRRGAHAAGLGWADRLGGAALGLLEGAVVAGVLLAMAIAVLGRNHEMLRDTRSLAALGELERMTDDEPLVDVAAPPR